MPKKKTHEEFVNELKETHPNLTVLGQYNGDKEYIEVRCNIHHHMFNTKPNWLHHGSNCQKCYNDRRSKTLKKDISQLLIDFKKVHKDKYKYPNLKAEYHNDKSTITIVCPIHGTFPQTVNHHLRGQGCQKCNQSHLEEYIENILKTNNINYISQWKNLRIIGRKSVDFYLPEYNIAIECQGTQHFKPIEHFGGNKTLEETIKRDVTKFEELNNNDIKLLYITEIQNANYLNEEKFNNIYIGNVLFKEDIEIDNNTFISQIK